MNTKLNIFLWALYDFANSFTQIAFSLYFAQWIVVEQRISDLSFNLAFVAAAFLLLLTVPVVGFLLDTRFRRISGLRIATSAMIIFYLATASAAIYGNGILALTLFCLGFYSFLLTFTFYTPLLVDITSVSNRGKVSGWGFLANFSGQIAVLLLTLPFAMGTLSLFGSSPRVETLFPAIVTFAIFALPMLLFFFEPKKEQKVFQFKSEVQNLLKEAKLLFLTPGVALFLLAHFLFYDAILTASNNFSIFLENVWRVEDLVKTGILLGIFVTAAIGSILSGFIADKIGHKKTFTYIVGGWLIILPTLALVQNFSIFMTATTLMGFWFGASWTLSRSIFSYIAPEGSRNLAFGFFGLIERASSLLGPLVWGLVATGMISYGDDRYRLALLTMTIFVLGAFIALRFVKSSETKVA